MRQVDKDGSGEIGFKEFLAILQPKEAPAGKSGIDKIIHLQEVKNVRMSPTSTHSCTRLSLTRLTFWTL